MPQGAVFLLPDLSEVRVSENVSRTVTWAQLDIDAAVVDQDHLVTAVKRHRIAAARQ